MSLAVREDTGPHWTPGGIFNLREWSSIPGSLQFRQTRLSGLSPGLFLDELPSFGGKLCMTRTGLAACFSKMIFFHS